MWEYFANLYKNSNKGIKGRGKDRKVGSNSMALNSGVKNLDVKGRGEYSMSGAGRGNMIVGVGAGRREISQYKMLDVDEESQSSHSGSTVSVGTCDDGLAFPERM